MQALVTLPLVPFCLLLFVASVCGADDLPTREPGEPFDFEPGLRLTEIEPGAEVQGAPEEMPVDLEKSKAALEAAKRKQERWQQLARRGILSKAEAESTDLQVARAMAKYSQARLLEQKRQIAELRKRADAGQLPREAVEAAEAALATSIALAAESSAALQRTQILLAEANLHRQRQLQAAGIGSSMQVQRAEALLQKLKATSR